MGCTLILLSRPTRLAASHATSRLTESLQRVLKMPLFYFNVIVQGSGTCVNRTITMKRKKPIAKGFAASVEPALKRAAKVARKTAKMYGTPVYFWKNDRVVAEKP